MKLFSSACRPTRFNEHYTSQLCDDRSNWNCRSVKAQRLASHFSSSRTIKHRTTWCSMFIEFDIWCSINRVRGRARSKNLGAEGAYELERKMKKTPKNSEYWRKNTQKGKNKIKKFPGRQREQRSSCGSNVDKRKFIKNVYQSFQNMNFIDQTNLTKPNRVNIACI